MRAVVQRVSQASVTVDQQIIGEIQSGLMVLLGVEKGDTAKESDTMAEKIVGLRIFEDEQGKMNLSLKEVEGEMLVVSQFTLLGDCRKGRRPSFVDAADPDLGNELYEKFVSKVSSLGIATQTGKFRTHMKVNLTNDGPVTMLIDSNKTF